MTEDQRNVEARDMPLSFWINVALSFVFVFVGVTFLAKIAFWKFALDLVGEEGAVAVGWVIFGVGVVLGLFNAYRYFMSKTGVTSK